MSLEEQLAKIRSGGAKRISEDKRAIMLRATQELRDSGIMERVIKVGDTLPPFDLQNADGIEINSADLLAGGTVVMTIFRGHW